MMISTMSLIVVVGSPRSGTTMTAGLLRSAGAWFGSAATAPGMSNLILQERLFRPFVQMCAVDPDDPAALPVDPLKAPRMSMSFMIERELKWQGWSGSSQHVVGIKDSQAVGLVPSILAEFPRAQIVVVRRDVEGIAKSCMHTDWMKPHRSFTEWTEWAGAWERTLSVVHNLCGQRAINFWPSTCVRGDFTAARQMCDWCGLGWDERTALNYVNPRSWGDGRTA